MLCSMGSCAKRVLLSDEELAQVFHDAFLTNAYVSTLELRLDSLRLYDQIFERYGYTADDVQYTIGNFSKRKSARLGDVVERAITMLEEEGKRLDLDVAILDSVNAIARRKTTHVVYSDSLVELRQSRDTTDLRIVIDDLAKGEYTIGFDYLIGEDDEYKRQYMTRYWFESDEGKSRRLSNNNISLSRQRVQQLFRRINAHNDADRMVVKLVDVESKSINHDVTFKNITIRHIPTIEDACEILFDERTKLRLFGNEGLFSTSQDSL